MKYSADKKIVEWDQIEVEASVNADQFTTNGITLRYYNEPSYADLGFDKESPANIQNTLLIGATIHPNDMEHVAKHAAPSCRFKHADGREVKTSGILVTSPINVAQDKHSNTNPNAVKCKTPLWNLQNQQKEAVVMDISMNG